MNAESQRLAPLGTFDFDFESDDQIAARMELLEERVMDLTDRLDSALGERADLMHVLRRAMVTLAGEADRQNSYILQQVADECATVLHGVVK